MFGYILVIIVTAIFIFILTSFLAKDKISNNEGNNDNSDGIKAILVEKKIGKLVSRSTGNVKMQYYLIFDINGEKKKCIASKEVFESLSVRKEGILTLKDDSFVSFE